MLDVISTVYGMLLRRLATSPASNGAQPELTVRGLRCGGEGAFKAHTCTSNWGSHEFIVVSLKETA